MARSETLVIRKSEVASLRKGDVITHIDGRQAGPFYVSGRASAERIPIDSTGRAFEIYIYPDTNISAEITVERTHRSVARTVSGMKFINIGERNWRSEDNRYSVYWQESGVTECEHDHPVKLTNDAVRQAQENRDTAWAKPILAAHADGKRGYTCKAGSEHWYHAWMVWDNVGNDYAFEIRDAESFKDAAEALVSSLQESLQENHR